MSKGFGVAALIIAILAVFVPLFGIFLSAIAVVLAAIAALSGDRIFAVATPLVAGVNTFFMSPSIWAALAGSAQNGEQPAFVAIILVFLALPMIAIALNTTGKIVLNEDRSI